MFFRRKKTIANVRVGRPESHPRRPSHVWGVHMGNQRPGVERQEGHEEEGMVAKASADRSTGINAPHRNPIDPSSPNLPPP